MKFATRRLHRLRSLLIALVVLALSAGVALAGRSGLSTTTTPQTAEQPSDQGDQDESEAPEADAPETEAPETEAPDATDAADAGSSADHPDNHGKLVSEAAQLPTPDGFDNHGAYVRTIANKNFVAPTTDAPATHGKSKSKNR